MGVRSPGQSAPVRGRTMKEYEEQLAQLKKENFNLKLRIYFLEERTSRMGECPDKEVETEALRKERDEKEDLLVQASRLVELTDKQYREQLDKLNESKEHEIGLLKRRIQELEKAMKACTEVGESVRGHELRLEDSNMNSELSRSPSLGGQQDKNRSQEVTEMSQVERLRGESERTNHLECDLQADQVRLRCQALEAELKQRDHRLEELLQKLKQRGQELAEKDLTEWCGRALWHSVAVAHITLRKPVGLQMRELTAL
uniref:(California timema) hypothetical protein n=1 Tax=Timema californicum TaxID=61474 RepID=A0A7R9JIB9_TIMCA|nr:unnamed protein product [Timema californicum]